MKRTLPLLAVLLAVALLSRARPAEAAKGALLEKTVDVPRDAKIPLDLTYEKATLTSVESLNDPKESDVKEASEKDPTDRTFVLMRFRYNNADYVKHRVKLRAILLDESGGVIGESGRTGTLDAGKTDDTISFPMRVKTLEWPKAAKLKVIAAFLE